LDGPPPPPSSGLQQRREIQQSLKHITTAIPQNTTFQKTQPTSVFGVLGEPTACEHPQPNDVDQTLVLPDYQAKEDLEYQIKTLGAEIDAFAEARRSITQTLRRDVQVRSVCFEYIYSIFIRVPETRCILLNRNAFRISRE